MLILSSKVARLAMQKYEIELKGECHNTLRPRISVKIGQPQAITWTNADILSIGPFGTNFGEISIKIQAFSLKKMRLKCRLQNVSQVVQILIFSMCAISQSYP